MKEKVLGILVLFLFIALSGVLSYALYDNSRLNNVIDNQNAFIKEVTGKESEFDKESKKYRDSLTSYTNKISYLLEGKTISSSEFVKAYDRLRDKSDSLQRELDDLKFIYRFAKSSYGFDVKLYRTDSTLKVSTVSYTKADSAQTALQFFHDRLKRTKTGWTIDTTGPKDLEDVRKKIKELNKKSKAIVDSAKAGT